MTEQPNPNPAPEPHPDPHPEPQPDPVPTPPPPPDPEPIQGLVEHRFGLAPLAPKARSDSAASLSVLDNRVAGY